ncbi:hypothetical protein HT576_13680 [Haloterrigena sp. SYSU A121-1]|uniref:Uncharacterized protein n=1 Tax=Haloterrigena gelatinilytica TaxID=2741724 RepID=A0A8J8KGI1_9EURY|nr:hypothetical protein [Haloterrigena gelatinilytica]NUB92067.1 hypothetical protein [Haloterrigena gelatinilytica]
MSDCGRSHRRRFLSGVAAVGSAALAGCSALSWTDDGRSSFTAADAADVLADETEPPEIEWPVPVVPTSDAVDDGLERVETLLADVPDSLEAEAVPNGVVRQSIGERRDEARDYRDEAAAATGDDRYHALRTTREARDAARVASTTLDAIEGEKGTIVADLREERHAVRSSVNDRLSSVAYRGGDGEDELLRAALFYARQESDLRRAAEQLSRNRWNVDDGASVIDIGDGAGVLEFATATRTVWEHLAARFDGRTDESTDLKPIFDAALETSTERIESVTIPDRADDDWLEGIVDADLDDQHLGQVLWRTVDPVSRAADGLNGAIEDGHAGIALTEAVRFEARYRAFERVRGRIDDGTLAAPESVAEIRAERTAAIEAAASAVASVTEPSIGAYVLAETLRSLEWTDDGVRRAADNDPEVGVSLLTEYGEYARIRAQFEALPDAVEAFRERLRSA